MARSPFNPVGRVQSLNVAPVTSEPCGRIWPNGNFSMGTRQAEGFGEGILWEDGGYQLPDYVLVPDPEPGEGLLTSSNALISHKPVSRRRKGLSGISGYGQQMLRSAAYLVERDYGKSDLCFATLTLPTLPSEARQRLQQNWAVLLNRLVQYLSRKLLAAGRPLKVFGCVEVQSQRLEKYREGYLHLHAIWPSHSNQAGRVWAVEWDEIRTWWKEAIERFAEVSLTVYPRVELSPVKKSAENYLGKYLSKGGGLIEEFIKAEGEDSCPTAWWFCSQEMKSQIADETVEGRTVGVLLDAMIQTALENSSLDAFEWIRHVDMKVGDVMKTVGWCGRLTRCTADELAEFARVGDMDELTQPSA